MACRNTATYSSNSLQAPVLLRLAFHDAATFETSAGDGGANASVQYEFARPENRGLKRGWCGCFLKCCHEAPTCCPLGAIVILAAACVVGSPAPEGAVWTTVGMPFHIRP